MIELRAPRPERGSSKRSECNRLWLLKNSLFAPNGQIWGDRKCLPNPRRSIVGLPDAILFLRISRVGVFQQPLLISTVRLGHCTETGVICSHEILFPCVACIVGDARCRATN